MSIFPNIKLSKADKFCPILALWPSDNITVTKGGKFARVIELTGKDYSGLAPEIIESLFETRKNFFEGLDSDITVLQHSHRMRVERKVETENFINPMAGKIANIWNGQFEKSFRTRHFLIFVTDPDIKDQIQLLVRSKDEGETREDELLRKLDDCIRDIFVRLEGYGPRELSGDDLSSYWASLLNGKQVYQKKPDNGVLEELLSGTTLRWPRRSRFQIYESDKKRFSAWLYIKAPANATNQGLLESLFELKEEISIYQTIATISKPEAMSLLEDKEKNAAVFSRANDIIMTELAEIQARIQADDISMISHRWAIEIFGNSRDELENAVTVIKNSIESFGYRTVRERVNQEALFWSRFPEMQGLNCRRRFLTSENASHFATFATVGEGYERCSWGPAPVSVFKTKSDSEYSFIFHVSPEKTTLGNTLVIGGTGSGKTTLISFLLSQCFKYPNFRILAFDRVSGMKIFTRMHDGNYQDFENIPTINPLQLNDTSENRAFLSQWFQVLTEKTDDKSIEIIGKAILQAFELEKNQRTLENIADAFGLKQDGSIRKALDRWLPGGAMGDFFNGKQDSLDFTNPLVAFDMTTLLNSPDVLGPMTYYLFHKLFLTAREKGGYAVFVDELGKYLDSELFAPKIQMMLEEIRKTDGIFIGAIQEAGAVLDHKIAPKIKNNIGTYILFPEPRAERKHYVNELRLNETEFNWIRRPNPREIMVKRKDGESVVLNINLKPLENYLRVFNSSSDNVQTMETLRRKTDDWKTLFINGERRHNSVTDMAG